MGEFFLGVLMGAFIGACVFVSAYNWSWKFDTVSRGLAIYCPTDGSWAWVGECK
jgi:1,4-dihydroxy-2-naphthoate octaprenyltransferase